MNAADLKQSSKLKCLLVGRSGTGKTSIVGTFPGKIYVFDLDKRIHSLRGNERVDFDWFTKDNFYATLAKKVNDLQNFAVNPKTFPYQNILFSSVTSLVRLSIKEAMGIYGASGEKNTRGILQMPELQQWMYLYTAKPEIFDFGLFTIFERCDVNLFLEAHLVNDYELDPATKQMVVSGERVLAPDKFAEEIPTSFDEIWHFKKKVGINADGVPEFKCYFRSTIARTNFKDLPNDINFTNKDFYSLIKDKLK